ncbi:hypothetical protein TIFTF001_025161 [Ficus carica]|uniref:VQ domain-containing protein n=1 Tax=Ficus carica TaxID=3494 RepID=A0AA88AWH3_FICCA|nr:hypothetical protein TIFTF001_025161 [Ficus carica]
MKAWGGGGGLLNGSLTSAGWGCRRIVHRSSPRIVGLAVGWSFAWGRRPPEWKASSSREEGGLGLRGGQIWLVRDAREGRRISDMMSTDQETKPISSNNEWLQYYQQTTTLLNQDHGHHHLHQGGHAGGTSTTMSKPIRRRSRASKKTPTTLLNANANNFRALVQKFTGCPKDSLSLADQKGPVNLNFGLKNATPIVQPDLRNHYDNRPESQTEVVPPQNQQQQQQQQQSYYFQDNVNYNNMGENNQCTYSPLTTEVFFNPPTSSMNAGSATEISNGFVMAENLSINEFGGRDSFSNEYFMQN